MHACYHAGGKKLEQVAEESDLRVQAFKPKIWKKSGPRPSEGQASFFLACSLACFLPPRTEREGAASGRSRPPGDAACALELEAAPLVPAGATPGFRSSRSRRSRSSSSSGGGPARSLGAGLPAGARAHAGGPKRTRSRAGPGAPERLIQPRLLPGGRLSSSLGRCPAPETAAPPPPVSPSVTCLPSCAQRLR